MLLSVHKLSPTSRPLKQKRKEKIQKDCTNDNSVMSLVVLLKHSGREDMQSHYICTEYYDVKNVLGRVAGTLS